MSCRWFLDGPFPKLEGELCKKKCFLGNLYFMINNKRSAKTNILFIFIDKLIYKAFKMYVSAFFLLLFIQIFVRKLTVDNYILNNKNIKTESLLISCRRYLDGPVPKTEGELYK